MSQSTRPQQVNRNQQADAPPHANGNGNVTQRENAPAGTLEATLEATIGQKQHKFIPLGETEEIVLTPWLVMEFLAHPTKKGIKPNLQDCLKFTIMCRQRKLNPFAGDAYMIGYDTQDGPKFSVITSIQAMLSRAELNDKFEGIESGVIVQFKDGDKLCYEERQGDLLYDGETLLGGWCKVYRSDRKMPNYQRLELKCYNKGTPQWRQDPAGMIGKCAESAALRQAFPSINGGLYLKDEVEAFVSNREPTKHTGAGGAVTLDVLSKHNPQPAPDEPKQAEGTVESVGQDAGKFPPGYDPFGGAGGAGVEIVDDATGEEIQIEDPGDDAGLTEADLMQNWQADIETATTNGALDHLAVQADKEQQGIRGKLMEMIAKRRVAIRKGNGKAKPEQPGLPGAGA